MNQGGQRRFFGQGRSGSGSGSGWGGGGGGRGWGGGGGGPGRGQGKGDAGRGRGCHVWERDQANDEPRKESVGDDQTDQEKMNEKWQKAAEKVSTYQEKAEKDDEVVVKDKEGNQTDADSSQKALAPAQNRNACEIYGLFNHATKDCRRMICEICGYNNHVAYDCRRCIPWNVGPELCAAQVEDQSFFFIEECIDLRMAKDKENIGVISILEGKATAKQIEQQFMLIGGASSWKWNARQVGDNKFVMRFPNAKMVYDWGQFKGLAMMTTDAYMRVEQWTARMEAKGVLGQAWFRVKDIPVDQRSIRTIAKVGGLVGKVMEIDEKTRFKAEFVRVKIACRDVQKVPNIAEGTLGIHLHDLIFEHEVPERQTIKTLSSGIKISKKEHDLKRFKASDQSKVLQLGGPSNQARIQSDGARSSKGPQKQNATLSASSAPPKMQGSGPASCFDKDVS